MYYSLPHILSLFLYVSPSLLFFRNRMIDVLLIIDNDSQYITRQLLTYSSTVTNNRASAVTNNRSVIHTINGGVHLNGTIRRDEGVEWIDGKIIFSL